jgi:hypothetical protein
VLGSGLYLWWGRRKTMDKRIDALQRLRSDFAVDLEEARA